jgi:hypothetical protein
MTLFSYLLGIPYDPFDEGPSQLHIFIAAIPLAMTIYSYYRLLRGLFHLFVMIQGLWNPRPKPPVRQTNTTTARLSNPTSPHTQIPNEAIDREKKLTAEASEKPAPSLSGLHSSPSTLPGIKRTKARESEPHRKPLNNMWEDADKEPATFKSSCGKLGSPLLSNAEGSFSQSPHRLLPNGAVLLRPVRMDHSCTYHDDET